jgi:hypothetical protein
MDSHPSDRAPQRRAAHNSIFFLFPAFLGLIRPTPWKIPPSPAFLSLLLARPVLGHTVKELVSRGLKSRSGVSHRDRRSVSRPPSVVAAREASAPPLPPSTHFENFFRIFADGARWALNFSGAFIHFHGPRSDKIRLLGACELASQVLRLRFLTLETPVKR